MIRNFITVGRREHQLQAFLAELDGRIVGSAACQLQTLPYPDPTAPTFRKLGYIWSVYVAPDARRRGIASQLVDRCVEYLRSIGCTKAVLHASDAGESIYAKAGFKLAKEMRLDL